MYNVRPAHPSAFDHHSDREITRKLEQLEANVAQMDLNQFVKRVNRLIESFVPEALSVQSEEILRFDRETILFYQEEGIIDRAHYQGSDRTEYGFRQILQALLLKKMLVRGLPLRRIAFLLKGMENNVYKRLLSRGLEGIAHETPMLPSAPLPPTPTPVRTPYHSDEFLRDDNYQQQHNNSYQGHSDSYPQHDSYQPQQNNNYQRNENWERISLIPGVELHLSDRAHLPSGHQELSQLVSRIERVLESHRQQPQSYREDLY